MEIGKARTGKVMGSKIGLMDLNMRDFERTIKRMVTGSFTISMGQCLKAIGTAKKPMERVCIRRMELTTKESGQKIYKKAMVLSNGQTVRITQDSILRGKNVDLVDITGLMEVSILATGRTTNLTVQVYINGLMVENTRVNGRIIAWKGKECTNG